MLGDDTTGKPARELPCWVPWVIVALVVAAAGLVYLLGHTATATQAENDGLHGDNTVLEQQRNATAQQGTTLANQVALACDAGGATADDLRKVGACQQAAQVQSTPIAGPAGATGPRGAPGESITGPTGAVGATGAPGGTGPQGVAGAPGDQGVPGETGQPGPRGPQGETGQQGPMGLPGQNGSPADSYTMTFPDQSTQTCTRDGGTDTDPHYQCGPVQPAVDDGGGLLGG